MRAALTAELFIKPKKKNILKPNSPIKPVKEMPFMFLMINCKLGNFLNPKKTNVPTPNKNRQKPASIKPASFNIIFCNLID